MPGSGGLIDGGRGGGLGGALAPGGSRGGTIMPCRSSLDSVIVRFSASNSFFGFLSAAAAAISISPRSSGCVESPTLRFASGFIVRSLSASGSVCRRLEVVGRPGAARVDSATASAIAASAWIAAGGGSPCGVRSASRYLPITRARRHRLDVVSASSGCEEQRDQVRAEGARCVLELLLDHGRLAAKDLDAARGVRGTLDERGLDRDDVIPRAGLGRERDEHLARVFAIGCPREGGEHVGDRTLGIVDALVEDLRAAQVELDALGRRRGGERDIVGVEQRLPPLARIELCREAIELGEQAAIARRDRDRLGNHGHRARLVREAALEQARELARQRDEALRLRRDALAANRDEALALVGHHLGELAPQAVGLARTAHVGERLLVGRFVMGAAPPAERALGIGELVRGRRGDPLDERAARLGVVSDGTRVGMIAAGQEREHALEHGDVLLPLAELREQVGGGGERLVLIGIELEHPLERLQRARRVVEPIAADHADLEAARDLPDRLGRQVHLALGDPHRGIEVTARLVQAAQRGVGLEMVRVELADEMLEGLDRLGRARRACPRAAPRAPSRRCTRARGRPRRRGSKTAGPAHRARPTARATSARRGRAGTSESSAVRFFGVSSSTRCHALSARAGSWSWPSTIIA